MRQAYKAWHRQGRVHSVETWVDGHLVGGLYAVALGKMVFGESMFALQTDASKIALCALVAWCRDAGVSLIDCQQNTHHLASLGAREMPRAQFEQHLRHTLGPEDDLLAPPGLWTYDVRMWSSLHLEPGAQETPEETPEKTPHSDEA